MRLGLGRLRDTFGWLKGLEEFYQFPLVLQKDIIDRLAFVRVCNKDLENMECFILDVPAFVPQKIHQRL